MRRTIFFFLTAFLTTCSSCVLSAQDRTVETINSYGTFDRWSAREVKESGMIGGRTNQLFEFFGNYEVTRTDKPFTAPEGYLWRTNNVMAVVAGVKKTNNTVYPEKRG